MSVSNATPITSTCVQSPSASGSSSASVASTPLSLLPDPSPQLESSGDIGAEIASMAVQSGQAERQTDEQARAADEEQQAREQDSEVQAMRDEAGRIRESAAWTGVSGIVEGLGECGAGVAGLGEGTTTDASRASGQHWSAVIRGVGQAAGASAKVFAATSDADKASLDADAAMHKATADQAANAASDEHDAAANADETITAALSFYREYVSTQAQTWNAALHRS